VPPHVYLNAVRLANARQLLLTGVPLATVAATTGFADQSHFTRRFKGATGLSPGAWLRQMRRP
jgi:AraC-like DNA-binding protein